MIDGKYFSIVVGLVIAVVVSAGIMYAVVDEDMKEYVDDSATWCDEHNGRLVNVQSFSHGGLHCELPNGTSVHMSDVVTVSSG